MKKNTFSYMVDFFKLFVKLNEGKSISIVFISVCFSITEFIGVASVFPIFKLLIEPSLGAPIGGFMLDKTEIIIGLFFLYIIVYILKLKLYHTLMFHIQNQRALLQDLLIIKYRNKIVKEQITRLEDISSTILSEVDVLVNQLFSPILKTISATVFIIISLVSMVVINPFFTALVISYVSFILFLVAILSSKRLLKAGEMRSIGNAKRFNLLDEIFGSLQELILLKKDGFAFEKFREKNGEYRDSLVTSQTLNQLPRFSVEASVILLILIVILILGDVGIDIDELPYIATFGLLASRLVPQFSLFGQSAAALKFHGNTLTIMIGAMREKPHYFLDFDASYPAVEYNSSVEIKKLDVNVGTHVLSKECIRIERGKLNVFIGPSGSGKTSIVEFLLGFRRGRSKEVRIDGVLNNSNEKIPKRFISNAVYVPQESFLFSGTVVQNIVLDREVDKDRLSTLVQSVDISQEMLKREINLGGAEVSGGQKQRISLLRGLIDEDKDVVLDEPTASLDFVTAEKVMKLLRQEAKTRLIVLITHDMEHVNTTKDCVNVF